MEKEFYSNGKLLITGEYAILGGATGLALPTTFGQSLTVKSNTSNSFSWKSIDEQNNTWFEAEFSLPNLKTLTTTNCDISNRLSQILTETQNLNPTFLTDHTGYNAEAKLTFPRNWGLGSSSTLIANITRWAEQVNPYQLLAATFGGSGYDIACATHNNPILFKPNSFSPSITEVSFNPPFKDQLHFIYLNQKKNSREAIAAYRNLKIDKDLLNSKINEITQAILECTQLSDFERLITKHELLLSKTLQIPTIKESLFPDYNKAIKSLGAWGGDFILATGTITDMSYFSDKGYKTILSYSEIILGSSKNTINTD